MILVFDALCLSVFLSCHSNGEAWDLQQGWNVTWHISKSVTHIQALWHIIQLLLATGVPSKQKITFC